MELSLINNGQGKYEGRTKSGLKYTILRLLNKESNIIVTTLEPYCYRGDIIFINVLNEYDIKMQFYNESGFNNQQFNNKHHDIKDTIETIYKSLAWNQRVIIIQKNHIC
jgi:hypothetical protein